MTAREKAIATISNGITAYSLLRERDNLSNDVTMYDFVLKATPEKIKPNVTADLIDEVFVYVSSSHSS